MASEEDLNRQKTIFRTSFQIGRHEIVAEMSPRRYREDFYVFSFKKDIPLDYRTNAIERVIKESCAGYARALALGRTDDFETLLHHAHRIYFLDAHGDAINHGWYFLTGQEEEEQKARKVATNLAKIKEEGVDAAILTCCNPQRNGVPLLFPIIYPTDIISFATFRHYARLVMPEELPELRGCTEVLNFMGGLCEMEKALSRERGYDTESMTKNTEESFEKLKEKIKRRMQQAAHYDPHHVQQYEGVTFITSSGTDYAIQNGCVRSRRNSEVSGLEVAVIGALTEREREHLEKPAVLDTEEGKAELIRHLRRPNYGLCLFLGYSLRNLQLEELMSIAPQTFTSPVIGTMHEIDEEKQGEVV